MRITILTVADCPNAQPALEQVTAALDGRQAQVDLVEVADEGEAARLGMHGSPTILLDGIDPFAPLGAGPSLSCRLYREADGTVSGVPDESALRQVLAGEAPGTHVVGTSDCCTPQPLDALDVVGRAGRGRRAPAEHGLRAVHQEILRHFADTGAAPDMQTLQPVAEEAMRNAAEVLAELAAEDFLTLDETGSIRAAYPFSAISTRHRVRLESGVDVWSMCAIDALGISAMLGQDAVISSTDPVGNDLITVTATTGTMWWKPATAVVFVGQRRGGGPAASLCCDALNFFTDAANARAWMSQHPDVPGQIVDQPTAERIGRQTFGPLLAP